MHTLEDEALRAELEQRHYFESAHSLVPNWIDLVPECLMLNLNPDRTDEVALAYLLPATAE